MRRDGVSATFAKCFAAVVDRGFDMRHGLDTCASASLESLTITEGKRESGREYQAARVLVLRRLFRHLTPQLPPQSVFVDFGCGKGRVLLVAMEFGFKQVKGVEFARELCLAAHKNISKYKSRKNLKPPASAIEADATTYPIGTDENVFFMYNPFDETVMARVIENITVSVRTHPRPILIVYLNPRCHEVIDARPEFALVEDSHIWGNKFKIYRNLR